MKNRTIQTLAWMLAAAALALAPLAGMAEEPAQITSGTGHVIVAVGKTVALKLTITPAAARKAGFEASTSDESVATVDARGRIKGVAQGECAVTVVSKRDANAKLTIPVSVVVPVRKVTATADKTTLHVGETAVITCSYAPEEATQKQATYASSRVSVATVDENGVVTGVGRGQADITVTSADGAAKARVRVKVLQQPTSVTISPETLTLAVGRTGSLRATVLPKNADHKAVTWTSSDESVATVNSRGQVKSVAPGEAVITATCADDPSVQASVTVREVRLAKSIAFSSKQYGVVVGQTVQLGVTVSPQDTTDQRVTYQIRNPKIATVDENGVVTGVKGGKTTVTATSADGSKRRATATVEVIVPVTGVRFNHQDARIGANMHGYVTAVLEPKDATDHRMSWVSSDESVATVKGDANKVRISGRRWGRCQVTGTTADGGYTCTLDVNIGSLRHAVSVHSVEIKDGKPYLVLQNKSNMNVTKVTYEITGTDEQRNPVRMSADGNTLYGSYRHPLAPMEKTRHGSFHFDNPTNYPNLQYVSIAITGWETDTGYYDSDGGLLYSYRVPRDKLEWLSCGTDYYWQIQNNKRAN